MIIGAAQSGTAAAVLLKQHGGEVFVTDRGAVDAQARVRLERHGIPYEEYGHSEKAHAGEFAVISPGVPDEAPPVQHYLQTGRPVYSEIEVASWFNRSPVIAITGSNGKTTAASWMANTWKVAGRDHMLAGNIGVAFSDLVPDTGPGRTVILEVSSFQLDHIDQFRPQVSALLNITPDHLNRYQYSFENYTRSKMRIFENQTGEDLLIYNYDDPLLREQLAGKEGRETAPRTLPFSHSTELRGEGAYVTDDHIYLSVNGRHGALMKTSEVSLPGPHNLHNSLATALAAGAWGVEWGDIRESLGSFSGVEHRMERVRHQNGVEWFNDSKATNVHAVQFALSSFSRPVILILGGRDKGNDYSELRKEVCGKVRMLITLGESAAHIADRFRDVVPMMIQVNSMQEAVQEAGRHARHGEVVLLSPACASFDMYESYEQRGEDFKQAVNRL